MGAQGNDESKTPLIAVDTMAQAQPVVDDDEEIVYVGYVEPEHAEKAQVDASDEVVKVPEPADEPEPVDEPVYEEDDDPLGVEGPRPLAQKIVIVAVIAIIIVGGAYLLDYWGVLNTGVVDLVNSLTGRA